MRKQSIYDRILTSPTSNVNKIAGDKGKIADAIWHLEEQGLIEVVYDEQSRPIVFKVTKRGKSVKYNGGYRIWGFKQCWKKYKQNIFQFLFNLFTKFIGIVIVLAICKAIS